MTKYVVLEAFGESGHSNRSDILCAIDELLTLLCAAIPSLAFVHAATAGVRLLSSDVLHAQVSLNELLAEVDDTGGDLHVYVGNAREGSRVGDVACAKLILASRSDSDLPSPAKSFVVLGISQTLMSDVRLTELTARLRSAMDEIASVVRTEQDRFLDDKYNTDRFLGAYRFDEHYPRGSLDSWP